MAPDSSTLAWKIPWTEEPGGLQSMESLRIRHGWATSLSLFTFMHWRKWQPTPVCSCLENPRDGGAWWAAISGVAQSQTQLKQLSSSSSSQLHQKTPGGSDSKKTTWQCRRCGFNPWVGMIPWRRKWQPTPVFLPGKSHGQRNLVGYSPWDHEGSEKTERLTLSGYIMSDNYTQLQWCGRLFSRFESYSD